MALLTVFACGDDDGGGGGTEGSSTGGTGSATEAASSSTTEPDATTSGAEGSGSGSSGGGSSSTGADGGSSESGGSTGSVSDCEAQADEETCAMAMGCVWVGNAQSGTCMSDDPAVCPGIEDMMQCQQHPACQWDNQGAACVGGM